MYNQIHIYQVGCGGTGGYLTMMLSKYIKMHHNFKNIFYTIYDGDIIEEKNTKRQIFFPQHVGLNKAQVLGELYNVDYIPKYVDEADISLWSHSGDFHNDLCVIIGCCDLASVRLMIDETMYGFVVKKGESFFTPTIYIDGGNTRTTGNIFKQVYKYKNLINNSNRVIKNTFKNLQHMDSAPTCSELGDQTLYANMSVALRLYDVISEIISLGNTTVDSILFTRRTVNYKQNFTKAALQNLI